MVGARPATHEDLVDLAELAAHAVAEMLPQRGGALWARTIGRRPPFAEGLARAIDHAGVHVVCGTVDDVVVGYAVARLDELSDGALLAVVEDLFTDPQARHVGVGEAMMDDLVAWATSARAVGIDALALPGARDTKNFFEGFGLKARALIVHRDLS